jgi:small-conductance mechanosensitive channel
MQIREEVNYKIMDIVARHDAHFAFPSRTVYIEHPTDKEKGSPK